MVTRTDVITRLPEFADIEDGPYFDAVIASASRQVGPKKWMHHQNDGVILLTGHLLELGRRNGRSGDIKSEKVGDLQREYSVGNATTNSLASTSHGSEYLRLLKTLPTRPLVC